MPYNDEPINAARGYVAAFNNGASFTGPAKGMLVNGQTDTEALDFLKKSLFAGNAEVRENIINLLVDIGLQIDSPSSRQGLEVIHDQEILKIIVEGGFAKDDLGRQRSVDALRKLGIEKDLHQFSAVFLAALDQPTQDLFLLIAKTKVLAATDKIRELVFSDRWRDTEEVKIASAALGNPILATEFIAKTKEAAETADIEKFRHFLGTLSLIGTYETLQAIAGYLRTPLIEDVKGAYRKTMRLNVLEALRYNFPDQSIFYPNNVISDNDYAAAEQYCTTHFQIQYSRPRPDFMTFIGYPRMH